ncbi:hypothetical protein CMV_028934 [Castanea mollissima]|uniref:F-box protein n=1 Tax=Castanea mollissima TaxID=60419 RepID=A0A8J4QGC1_9ROSI|nr:hypothetical protein CMV_028934 [Castanea mollissima]
MEPWRLYVAAHKQDFMESQPPLVFLKSNAKRVCYFYSMFEKRLYKAILPSLVGKRCSGVSCRYFVMEDEKKSSDSQIWLLNPFTRHKPHFSSPPNPYFSVILASLATPLLEFVIIAIGGPFLQFCKSTYVNWTIYKYKGVYKRSPTDGHQWFVDGVVFDGMVLQGGSDLNLKGPRNKKKNMVDTSNWRPWSELHEVLLHLIANQLGAIDYLLFGCVCKGWRLYVAAHRKEFMASQPPLLVFLSTQAKRACHFYNIFDRRLYKAVLPSLVGKTCSGLSCGYAFVGGSPTNSPWWFVDGAVFKGKIYVLTDHGEIGVLNLNPHPYVTLLEIQSIGCSSFELYLLAFDEQLFMIRRVVSIAKKEVYELNFSKMEWVKMQNFKDQALFLNSDYKSSGFSNITRWRGIQQPMNCIDNLGSFLDGRYPGSFPIMETHHMDMIHNSLDVPLCKISTTCAWSGDPFWYFPNLSCNVDAFSDD